MLPLLGFRKYILLSQGCSEGDPAAIGRGCSSNKVNGPSLRDVKSGMPTVRGSNERQWSSESVVAGTTQDNKRKMIRWRDGYHPEENCSYLTQQFPFHLVWYKCRVSAMQCDKSFFFGKHFFLKFALLFMSHFPLPSSLPLPASLQAEICFSQLLLRLWLYCMGEVSPEGHLFHQVFYLHPKLYVHEKCGRVLHLAADADEILWKAWCTLTFADGAAIAEKWIA